MTVSYSLSGPWRILLKWKGSLWKRTWKAFALYMAVYVALNLVVRFALTKDQQQEMAEIRAYFQNTDKSIHTIFLLGFFVGQVLTRWWAQFCLIPWPDTLADTLSGALPASTPSAHLIRQNCMRWANLGSILCLRHASSRVHERFPTHSHLVKAGLMTKQEKLMYDKVDGTYGKWWLPLKWINKTIAVCEKDNTVSEKKGESVVKEVNKIKNSCCNGLLLYDWVRLPLLYTQSITLGIGAYFLFSLFSNQVIPPIDTEMILPWSMMLDFFFIYGWLVVAVELNEPFGQGDDSFDINWIIDRNLNMSYMLVCPEVNNLPAHEDPPHRGSPLPLLIPHTDASRAAAESPMLGTIRAAYWEDAGIESTERGCEKNQSRFKKLFLSST